MKEDSLLYRVLVKLGLKKKTAITAWSFCAAGVFRSARM